MPVTCQHVEIVTNGTITSGGGNSRPTASVYNFRRTTTVNPFSKAHVDTAFQAAIVVVVGLATNNRWTQSNNTIRNVDDATDAPDIHAHAVVGAVAGDSQTMDRIASLYLKTGLKGKHYRGFKRFGPLSESDATAPTTDHLNAGALTLWGNVAAAILGGFTDADGNVWIPEVLARSIPTFNQKTNPTTIIATDVTTILVNKTIKRMKKRACITSY